MLLPISLLLLFIMHTRSADILESEQAYMVLLFVDDYYVTDAQFDSFIEMAKYLPEVFPPDTHRWSFVQLSHPHPCHPSMTTNSSMQFYNHINIAAQQRKDHESPGRPASMNYDQLTNCSRSTLLLRRTFNHTMSLIFVVDGCNREFDNLVVDEKMFFYHMIYGATLTVVRYNTLLPDCRRPIPRESFFLPRHLPVNVYDVDVAVYPMEGLVRKTRELLPRKCFFEKRCVYHHDGDRTDSLECVAQMRRADHANFNCNRQLPAGATCSSQECENVCNSWYVPPDCDDECRDNFYFDCRACKMCMKTQASASAPKPKNATAKTTYMPAYGPTDPEIPDDPVEPRAPEFGWQEQFQPQGSAQQSPKKGPHSIIVVVIIACVACVIMIIALIGLTVVNARRNRQDGHRPQSNASKERSEPEKPLKTWLGSKMRGAGSSELKKENVYETVSVSSDSSHSERVKMCKQQHQGARGAGPKVAVQKQ